MNPEIKHLEPKPDYQLIPEKSTFLAPVSDPKIESLPEQLNLDGKEFAKKPEHHITVITFPKGRELKKLIEADPGLEEKIHRLLNELDWSDITIDGDMIRLEKEKKFFTMEGEGRNQRKVWHQVHAESIVQPAQLPAMEIFYQRLKDELGVDLGETPPIHTTLYTHGDPMGIAVNSAEEFASLNPKKIEL